MTNLDIQNAYLGLDQVDKVYLGTDVVWQPASSGSLLELVWDTGSTPDWYVPSSTPSEAYHKSRCKVFFGGQEIDSGDTGLTLNLNTANQNEWIEQPHKIDSRNTDGWIKFYWHNGGELQGNSTCSARSFDVYAEYVHDNQTYSAQTTIDVLIQPATGITFYGDNEQNILPFSEETQTFTWSKLFNNIYYKSNIEYAPGQTVSGSIANQNNSYNHGIWSAETQSINITSKSASWDGISYQFKAEISNGTGTVNYSCYWCGLRFPAGTVQLTYDDFFEF